MFYNCSINKNPWKVRWYYIIISNYLQGQWGQTHLDIYHFGSDIVLLANQLCRKGEMEEGGSEGGNEGGREKGGREGWNEGERGGREEGGREGGNEAGREGEREGVKNGGREGVR